MIAIERLRFDSDSTLILAGAVSLATAIFAWNQNRRRPVGGPISLAKTIWLNYALLAFLAIPFCLWRNPELKPNARALFGWVFALFAARAVVEMWMLYFTRAWRCIHGIVHDFVVLAVILALATRLDSLYDAGALFVALLICISLVVEAFMAWQFSKLAAPADGIYFADESPRFRFVNRASWAASLALYPPLAFLILELP